MGKDSAGQAPWRNAELQMQQRDVTVERLFGVGEATPTTEPRTAAPDQSSPEWDQLGEGCYRHCCPDMDGIKH